MPCITVRVGEIGEEEEEVEEFQIPWFWILGIGAIGVVGAAYFLKRRR